MYVHSEYFLFVLKLTKLGIGMFCIMRKALYCDLFSELILSNWIYKSSSLPFLSRFDADVTLSRPALLSREVSDCNGKHEFISQGSEPNTAMCDVQLRQKQIYIIREEVSDKKTNSSLNYFLVDIRRCCSHTSFSSSAVFPRHGVSW